MRVWWRMRASIVFPLVTMCCCISGCTPAPTPTAVSLVGTYQSRSSLATGTLVLHANGAYQQTILLNRGRSHTASGHWRLYSGDDRLSLTGFLIVDDANGSIPPRVTRSDFSAPISYHDEVDIMVDDDLNEFYRRVGPASARST